MAPVLRMTAAVYEALARHHRDPSVGRERVSFAFGRSVRDSVGVRAILLCEPPIRPADDCYLSQSAGHLALDPEVLNSVLVRFADSDADVFVNIHDHGFCDGGTTFSAVDDADDLRFAEYLRERFEPMLMRHPHIGSARRVTSLSIVLDQTSLDARFVGKTGVFEAIAAIDVVSATASRLRPNSARARRSGALNDDRLLRQRDFITPAQQALLADLRFGVVGCGGLGSILVEDLYRLGARRFVLIDPDRLEISNLNRFQGGRVDSIGRLKAETLAENLALLSHGRVEVAAAPLSVLDPDALPLLETVDVVLGCLDNHVARYFLNRFSLQRLVPYFDAGVNIATRPQVDFQSRYFAVIPGVTACAECSAYELIDRQAVDLALTDEVTAGSQRRAGYVVDRPEIAAAASAYPLNQRAAGTLATELLNWLCGFRPLATCAAEFWADGRQQRSDRANHPEAPSRTCAACALLGAGDQTPLPRPLPPGKAARLLTEARDKVLAASTTRRRRTPHGKA